MSTLINIAVMQVGWFACVLGAASDAAWIGTSVTAVIVGWHLKRAARPLVEIKLIGTALSIGLILDSALASSGLIGFTSGVWLAGLTTHWMLALWVGFATTLTSSLSWLLARPVLALTFGVVGGPIAYGSGAKLGALTLAAPISLVLIGCGWGVAMWIFVQVTRRLNERDATGGARMTRLAATKVTTLALLLTASPGGIESAFANSRIAGEWRFDVLLDDKQVGYHHFTLSETGESRELISKARFTVKFLFFTAYRYAHDTKEIWSGECLKSIDARTDDNGTHKAVRGSPTAENFLVVTGDAAQALQSCVMTFAYWNPSILNAARLLNPQTGEYVPVHVTRFGAETLTVRGVSQPTERFQLSGTAASGEKLQIDLWYSPDKQWLALESTTPDGHRLRYRIQ